jgi:hypothetical protein
VKIYANVDHLVPPSGLVLRARTLPLEARFLFSLHLSNAKNPLFLAFSSAFDLIAASKRPQSKKGKGATMSRLSKH